MLWVVCNGVDLNVISKFKYSMFTGRKAIIKITFVGLFCALIIVKFGREDVAPNILLNAKVENFLGSFGEFRPRKPRKTA